MSPIRICIISSFPPVKGGEATYAQDFVHAMEYFFQSKINEIYVLSHTEGRASHRSFEKKGKISVSRLYDSLRFLDRNIAFARIFMKIVSFHPDVVHLQYSPIPDGRYGGLLGESLFILFFLLKIAHIPFYITLHSIWLPDQAQGRIFEKTKSKTLAKLGMWYLKAFTHYFGIMPERLFLLINIRNSLLTKKFSQEYSIPIEKIKEEVHGVWVNDKQDKMITEIKINSWNIVCLGVINPSKGYEYMIKAMVHISREFPQASLIIAGSPPPTNYREGKNYIENLAAMINDLQLQGSITIKDKYLSDDEFEESIRTAGIVVLPYSKVVGASGIMHVAMRYRVPIIVAGSGPLHDELSEFVPVIPPMNSDALAKMVVRILSDPEYRALIIDRYERYLIDHDWGIVTKNIYEEYILTMRTNKQA